MFSRVSVRLGEIDPAREELTTDARLAAVKKGADDPGLVALHFQFGRYLLMGSSRRPAPAASQPPGHLERPHVGPVGIGLPSQHQPPDELLAGWSRQPGGNRGAPAGLVSVARKTGRGIRTPALRI